MARLKHKRFRTSGQQTVEFAAAMSLLVICIFVPLLDLGIIPVRWGLAAASVDSTINALSRSESLSQAYDKLAGQSPLNSILKKLGGVETESVSLLMIARGNGEDGSEITLSGPRSFPESWLPDGANCPCRYELKLRVKAKISPLITVPVAGQKIPGLNGPFRVTLESSSLWENLGRNPVSGEYFLNE